MCNDRKSSQVRWPGFFVQHTKSHHHVIKVGDRIYRPINERKSVCFVFDDRRSSLITNSVHKTRKSNTFKFQKGSTLRVWSCRFDFHVRAIRNYVRLIQQVLKSLKSCLNKPMYSNIGIVWLAASFRRIKLERTFQVGRESISQPSFWDTTQLSLMNFRKLT